MSVPGWLAAPLLMGLLAVAGLAIAARLPGTAVQRLVVGFASGAVVLHLILSGFDVARWRWSAGVVFGALVALAIVGIA
ncbi:MAG TPA: hypothetical protein VN811_00055, partial [Thermoanaerobaculia bacterium]|nr:hypothetical protein [Thermoanaerobaculia bacterium]